MAASDPALRPSVGPEDVSWAGLKKSRVDTVGDCRYVSRVVSLDRRPVGGERQLLHVFYPEDPWRQAYWAAIWPPLMTGGAAALLVATAALAIAHRVSRPIDGLRSQVQRIAEGDFQALPVPARDDEVRDLAQAINRMALQLARYEQEARHSERLKTLATLKGGIVHQIRNAATGARLALDLHRRECPTSDDGSGDDPLAVAARQMELIESHLKRLLAMGSPQTKRHASVKLRDVMQEAIALVRPMADHLNVPLEHEIPAEDVRVLGNEESLTQMAANLLVNAVEAAAQARVSAAQGPGEQSGRMVRASVSNIGEKQARLTISDSGLGPSDAMKRQLFEPFATDKPGGTGLGLAVARQAVYEHGGRIRWERHGDWTQFQVDLPLADAASLIPTARQEH
jgi:signal transduction histidine kinase